MAGPSLPPSPYEPRSGGESRGSSRWVIGGLLVLTLLLLLLALSLSNVTAEGPARRALGHSVAILAEVDAYLDDRYEALREEAAQGGEGRIVLSDFPVEVAFQPEEIETSSRESFRALLLERSAERVYREGASAFEVSATADMGFSSLQGTTRNGIDFLRSRPHNALLIATAALGVTAALLAVALVLNCRGYGRLQAIGVSVSLAALPFLVLAIAARFGLRVAADGLDDYVASEFVVLGEELAWAAIRNGIIFSVGAGVFLVLGIALPLAASREDAVVPIQQFD
jgi:hypothetical protein